MRSLPWSRSEAIASVRDQIWRYVTPALREEDQVLLAAALLQMAPSDVATFGRLHFLLSAEVGELLHGVNQLLRRLAVSSQEQQEISNDRIRGPIDWAATIPARAASGSRTTFVTRPATRAYQTPENEVLVHGLDAIVDVARRLEWSSQTGTAGVVSEVKQRVRQATSASQNRVIEQVIRVDPTPRTLARVRSGKRRRDYAPAVRTVQLHRKFVRQLDADAIRTAVEQRALAVADDPTLFELTCFFGVLDALDRLGWSTSRLGIIGGAVRVRLESSRGGNLDVWYQTAPPQLRAGSRYVGIQALHGFGGGHDLRPDLVFRLSKGGRVRWLLGEVKLGTVRSVDDSARAALHDLLAYRRVFGSALTPQSGLYGLGIAWGEALAPVENEDVLLSTPDTMGEALDMWLSTVT